MRPVTILERKAIAFATLVDAIDYPGLKERAYATLVGCKGKTVYYIVGIPDENFKTTAEYRVALTEQGAKCYLRSIEPTIT